MNPTRSVPLLLLLALAGGAGSSCRARGSSGEENAAMQLPFTWHDQTGPRDMPWLGKGGRARWYAKDRSRPWEFMDPRGPKIETRWGASGGSGEPPQDTAARAVAYLRQVGFLRPWPAYPADSGQAGATAFPYRITLVCLQPTVAILRFDLSAAIPDPVPEFSFGAFPPSHREHPWLQGTASAGLANGVMFGTRILDRGALLWFSPEAQVPPTPLDLSRGAAEFQVQGRRFRLQRRGEEWEVLRP